MSSIASGHERLRPLVLRAAEHGNIDDLRSLIHQGKQDKTLDDVLLRWALQKAAEKGQRGTVELLLEEDVEWDVSTERGLSPLYRAVERGHTDIVRILLERGADREAVDKNGRPVLHAAAWWNRTEILRLLIDHGANVNSKDRESRTVLHGLGADKRCRWGEEVVDIILATPINLEFPDSLSRTALHWAAVMGKQTLTKQLLLRRGRPRADIHAATNRGKTALHLAAEQGHVETVRILLDFDADPLARSDGGWTPLHNAADRGHHAVIDVILQAGCNVNVCTSAGMTPLHWAANQGHVDSVLRILKHPDVWRNPKDVDDRTPLLCAAASNHREVLKILVPLVDVERLSHDALGACNGFMATIVDFSGGGSSRINLPERRSVYEVLYGRDLVNPEEYSVTTLVRNVKSKPAFRWIHLPMNNLAWVETLITKAFLEEGAHDVEGLKALQATFGQQHRGPTIYSRSMRPLCQRIQRSNRPEEANVKPKTTQENGLSRVPTIGSDFSTPVGVKSRENGQAKASPKSISKDGAKGNQKTKGYSKTSENGMNTPTTGRRDRAQNQAASRGNMVLFTPYLHFETERRRAEMNRAIREAGPDKRRKRNRLATSEDEMLIRAYLHSSTQLHVRRSQDQFYLRGIDVDGHENQNFFHHDKDHRGDDRKVLMVDQLWMWILGRDLIITSFPQRWQQPRNDPYNVLDGITEGINSRTGDPVRSVYDLATLITSRCISVFDRHRMGNEDNQLLNMFESTIGRMAEEESALFSQFYKASAAATAWLKRKRRVIRKSSRPPKYYAPTDDDRFDALDRHVEDSTDSEDDSEPIFVDSLLDVGKETTLLAQCKDARDKLDMIREVLTHQRNTLSEMRDVIRDDLAESALQRRADIEKKYSELTKKVDLHIKDVQRMHDQAGETYNKILPLLDLKQKHANAFEARFARDQAASTARQGQVIMVFTIVTIVFLPMSFIAAFFAINVDEWTRDGLSLGYVSKFMFGIGFGISIPLIAVAFSLNSFRSAQRSVMRSLRRRQRAAASSVSASVEDITTVHALGRFSKDERKSIDTEKESMVTGGGLRRTFTGGSAWSKRDSNVRARWRDVEAAPGQ